MIDNNSSSVEGENVYKRRVKHDKKEHIAKDCKGKQMMMKRKVQEKSDDKENKKEEQGFGDNLK